MTRVGLVEESDRALGRAGGEVHVEVRGADLRVAGELLDRARRGALHRAFELKRRQVEDANAERFVTACGQCRITLNLGANKYKWDKKVDSLLELVADNLID